MSGSLNKSTKINYKSYNHLNIVKYDNQLFQFILRVRTLEQHKLGACLDRLWEYHNKSQRE